jgi:hypothetical protein
VEQGPAGGKRVWVRLAVPAAAPSP